MSHPIKGPNLAVDPLEAIVGRDTPTPLAFNDPDGHGMRYELVLTMGRTSLFRST